jgi:hypothetical protein
MVVDFCVDRCCTLTCEHHHSLAYRSLQGSDAIPHTRTTLGPTRSSRAVYDELDRANVVREVLHYESTCPLFEVLDMFVMSIL